MIKEITLALALGTVFAFIGALVEYRFDLILNLLEK